MLRHDSRQAHDAAEESFRPFLESPERHLGWFLSTQGAALGALREGCGPAPGVLSGAVLSDLLKRLAADLAAMRRETASISPSRPLDPLDVDYLVLGSRLGSETMRRSFYGNGQATPAFFRAGPLPLLWRRHCDMLDAVEPGSDRGTRITDDTLAGFALFEQAATAQANP